MADSSKPIKDHIPDFLQYCTKIGLLEKTIINYKNFLNKFIVWLVSEKLEKLLPHELTTEQIEKYNKYLLGSQNGKLLSLATQNYYLIALRALLNYFRNQGIDSMLPDKINLPRHYRRSTATDFLNQEQIELLLSAPDVNTDKGLRDRAILECLLATGVRVSDLVSLNVDQIAVGNSNKIILKNDLSFSIFLTNTSFFWLKEYLMVRNKYSGNERALFIHLNSPNKSENRLTVRSIERMVKEYGKSKLLDLQINPEILRRSYSKSLFDREIEISKTFHHKAMHISDYLEYGKSLAGNAKEYSEGVSWNAVERTIKEEISWLGSNIPVMTERFRGNHTIINCDECLFRKIAILIVSGKLKAVELRSEETNFWPVSKSGDRQVKKISRHGKEWHQKMMDGIWHYFNRHNYEIELEPGLNYGRADLGVKKDGNVIFIEVDTVSPYKLWFNFMTMKGVKFIVVPSENKMIEFSAAN